jgi:hypothetical protein
VVAVAVVVGVLLVLVVLAVVVMVVTDLLKQDFQTLSLEQQTRVMVEWVVLVQTHSQVVQVV